MGLISVVGCYFGIRGMYLNYVLLYVVCDLLS